MAKKLTATLLSFALAGTMIPANVTAEEIAQELTLKGFNATKSVITVDLNNVTDALDASSLDGRISLQKRDADGEISEITDFTVDVTEKITGTDADGAEVTTSEGNTVIITPAEGIEEGSLYYLTLYAGISDSDETIVEEDIKTGWFEVKSLYEDDFNVTYEADGTTPVYPYYINANNKDCLESSYWTASYRAGGWTGISDGKGSTTNLTKFQFRNSGQKAFINTTGFPKELQSTDFTVEYVMGMPKNVYSSQHYVTIRNTELINRGDPLNYVNTGYVFGVDTDYNYTNKTGSLFFNVNKSLKMKVPSYTFAENQMKIRAFANGSNLQYYVDNEKVFDVVDDTLKGASTVGFVGGCMHNNGAYSTIDDVSITKVVNYGEIDFSGVVYEGFNATKKVITLDFTGVNGNIDTESLDGRLEIIKKNANGEEYVYDYTVESKEAMTGTDATGVSKKANGNIVITPADGIEEGVQYKVNIYGGIADGAGVVMEADATTGWFMVEELFADDFTAEGKYSIVDGVYSAEDPYYWEDTDLRSKYYTMENPRVQISSTNGDGGNKNPNTLMWHGNGGAFSVNENAIPKENRVADYTVEYNYEYAGNQYNNPQHRLTMRANDTTIGAMYSNSTGYSMVLRQNPVTKSAATISNPAAPVQFYAGSKNIYTTEDFAPANGLVDVRMTVSGNTMQCYVNNIKAFDVVDDTYKNAGATGITDAINTQWSDPCWIDNLSITTVIDMDEIPESSDVLSYNADTDTVYVELDKADLDGNALLETALGGIKLYDKDGTEMSTSVSMQDNWILVKPETKLDIKKKYTVEVKGLTTKYGTIINDYSKDFQIVEAYSETFDTEESVTEGWSTRGIGSWENGQMRLYNQKESNWQNAVDYIYSNKYIGTAEPEYVTEFDLYVYDNDSDSTNALVFNELTFYSNKKHATAYNQGANTLNYGFGATRNLSVTNGELKSLYSAAKSDNFAIEAGKVYNVKAVNKNGTGFFYVNDVLEAVYDYSEHAPLLTGCLGFKLGGQTNAGIDNILCTYATDYVDDGGEGVTPEIAITEAIVSEPTETGVVTANVTVQNNTYAGESYVVAVAVYDANHKLLGVKTAKESNATVGTTKEYNDLVIENAGTISYAKVFLWDGLNTMNPIGTMREISGTTELAFYVNPSADLMSADGSPENPYPSIDMAIERVKSEVNSGAFNVNFTVDVAEGDIYLDDTLVINDYSGFLATSGTTITIKGQGTDKTFIKSGKVIDNGDFYKVTDNSILERVPEGARNYIYAVDLVGKGYIGENEAIELSVDGKVQTSAKYPNEGYLKTGEVTINGLGFECSAERISAWESAEDMYIYYMPNYFSYAYQVSAEGGLITTQNNAGFTSGKNYYVYNLIEELDKESEYYYDKTAGVLYIYSTATPIAKYEIYNMTKNLISLEYCDNVKFKDMTIENNGETLVSLKHTKNSSLENCVLRNGTKIAANISSGSNSGLLNCEIYDMGKGGVSLSGGNRDTLAKARNYVNKCAIHDCQRLDRSYTALVSMSGVGNYVVNSDIYNSYHQAITIYGNDLEVRNNKIYNVCTETADMGAIYAEGDWTLRGTVIEHNYFENIPSVGSLGAYAVYLDNGLSGITIKNNIFKDIDRQAVYINGGRDNLVTNNIFVDTGNVGAVSDVLNWGTGYSFDNPASAKDKLVKNLNKVKYQEEPYTKYENLSNILEDKPSIPKYNKFIGNVTVNSGGLATAWLRNMSLDELLSKAECEYDAKTLSVNDLTDYNGGDFTLEDAVADSIGFEWFDNSFGR